MTIKRSIFNEMKAFFSNKSEESMLLYESQELEGSYLDDGISIPEKAIKSNGDRVSIDARFIIFCIDNLAKSGKGMVIIHNHMNNLIFSPQDVLSMENIMKVALRRKLKDIHFMLFENITSEMISKHYKLNQHANIYEESKEKIIYE